MRLVLAYCKKNSHADVTTWDRSVGRKSGKGRRGDLRGRAWRIPGGGQRGRASLSSACEATAGEPDTRLWAAACGYLSQMPEQARTTDTFHPLAVNGVIVFRNVCLPPPSRALYFNLCFKWGASLDLDRASVGKKPAIPLCSLLLRRCCLWARPLATLEYTVCLYAPNHGDYMTWIYFSKQNWTSTIRTSLLFYLISIAFFCVLLFSRLI